MVRDRKLWDPSWCMGGKGLRGKQVWVLFHRKGSFGTDRQDAGFLRTVGRVGSAEMDESAKPALWPPSRPKGPPLGAQGCRIETEAASIRYVADGSVGAAGLPDRRVARRIPLHTETTGADQGRRPDNRATP